MTVLAGYSCLVRKSGVSTPVVAEPCVLLSGSTVFRISNSARRLIDPFVDFSFVDGTTTVAYSSIQVLDYLNAEVTLTAPLASGHVSSLAFNGNYLPITTSSDVVLESTGFKASLSCAQLDRTVFTGTPSDYIHKRIYGLQDVSISVDTKATMLDLATLASAQFAGVPVVVELSFGDVNTPRLRALTVLCDIDKSSSVDGFVETSLSFKAAAQLNTNANQVAGWALKVQP